MNGRPVVAEAFGAGGPYYPERLLGGLVASDEPRQVRLAEAYCSSKLHLAVAACCRVLAVMLTPGQAGDNPRLISLIRCARPSVTRDRRAGGSERSPKRPTAPAPPSTTCGDVGSPPRPREEGPAGPPQKPGLAGRPHAFDPEIYKRRNVVERAIARLKRYRALASRYAKRAVIYRSQILLVATVDWLS